MKRINKVTLFIYTSILLFSCSKENDKTILAGGALVKINIVGLKAEKPITSLSPSRNNKSKQTENVMTQSVHIVFDKDHILEAILTPQDISPSTQKKNTTSTFSDAPKADTERYNLINGTKYRVVVYNNEGNFVEQIVYSAGTENIKDLTLDAGETYTFIFLSFNQTIQEPAALGIESLPMQKLNDINTNNDIMYAKVVKQLDNGTNYLDVIFEHKSSEITTTIDASAIGAISDISGTFISPHYAVSDLYLADGELKYVTASTQGASVFFPEGEKAIKTSSPTIVASSENNNGTLDIGSITISGTTKTNLSIGGLHIQPGQRYNLTLKIKNPYELTDGLIWAPGNLFYDQSTQQYSFADQTETGSYFPSGKLLPGNIGIPFEENENGDPCSKVPTENGEQWRTPIEPEFGALYESSTYTKLNGADGFLYNGAVFLRYTGYYIPYSDSIVDEDVGYYRGTNFYLCLFAHWISYRITTSKYDEQDITSNYSYQVSIPLRCVRNK